ncbi:hypothetical protein E0Z10_g3336 [Xylaria hypoxylon]|uniref:Uncharacterized protein n=1 Tax=Xylaria hypoxylon TaxID=37992 RepID=A0A4Z0YMA5_9PEZI|nr:hypothetical protein E0Z10_g3336 [Xylaria hypoxylon]
MSNSQFVKDIPVRVPPPPGKGGSSPEPPSEWDMGSDDLTGSEYVSAETNDIPSGHEDRVKYLQNILLLSQKWLDIFGGTNTREQINNNKLPDDMLQESQMKRSDYRIKVYSTLLGSSSMGWFATSSEEIVHKSFEVERSQFHLTLMKAVLEGIVGIKSMTQALEKVLTSITEMVSQTGHYSEDHTLWSLFNVCQWDSQAKDVKASLRFVAFQVTADVVEVTTGKSTMETVKMDLTYSQYEVSLIESEWDYYKPKLEEFLHEMGDKSIRDPTDGGEIPVD